MSDFRRLAASLLGILLAISCQNCARESFQATGNGQIAATRPGKPSAPSQPGGGDNKPAPPVACHPIPGSIPVIKSLPSSISVGQLTSLCPSIGSDSLCGLVLLITDAGLEVYFTGSVPYDGQDDSMVGIVNLSRAPVAQIKLSSTTDIMGFDGDGIDTYDPNVSNNLDSTGYGGLNAYFTNIALDATGGDVNFIKPLAPKGGTSFFSLEDVLSPTSACLSGSP